LSIDKRKYLRPEIVASINNISLRARLVVEGYLTGLHKSPYHGFSVEFAEHRAYGPGDELRHLDWKLYGKTDRYYIKQYEEETNLRSYILLDISKSMTYASHKISKLDYGSYLASALTYLMLSQRDAVSLTPLRVRAILNLHLLRVYDLAKVLLSMERHLDGGDRHW